MSSGAWKILPAIATVLLLGACAYQQSPPRWVRTDGKPIGGDQALELQFEVDTTVCRGETQKANLTGFPAGGIVSSYRRGEAVGEVFNGCMAQHGYVLRAGG